MMTAGQVWTAISPYLSIASFGTALVWISSRWLDARMKSHFDGAMEDYRHELSARVQAAKIAEYAATVIDLKATHSEDLYRRANQLSWELFLWLPDDVYRQLGKGVGGSAKDLAEAMISVRKSLLANPGTLGPDDIIVHRPNIGRK
jgi:hypothetical protein